MAKLLLISVLIATVVIPVRVAHASNPIRGLKKAILYTLLFNAFYLLGLLVIYPRL